MRIKIFSSIDHGSKESLENAVNEFMSKIGKQGYKVHSVHVTAWADSQEYEDRITVVFGV